MKVYHIDVYHKAESDGIRKNWIKRLLCGIYLNNLNKPMNTATELISIPVTKVTCDGLNRPSNPKVLCHKKSEGPAITVIKAPINKSLNAPGREVFFISGFFIKIEPTKAELAIKPIPRYNKECDGVKNDSGSFKT
jgi:hypothetical protein